MAKKSDPVRLCMYAHGGETRIGVGYGEKVADLTRTYAMSLARQSPERAWAQALIDIPRTVDAFLS